MTTKCPKPDRSDFTPNFQKTEENDALAFGWAEGVLSDGRPYRLECWCQDQITSVTVFLSRIGLEDLDDRAVHALLEKEDLVQFLSSKRYATALPVRDPSGNDMLSINVVVGDDEEVYTTGGPNLTAYPRTTA